jgi:hypothetical protein
MGKISFWDYAVGGNGRQATESFANQKVAIPQSDRCAVNVWPQRDQTHHTRFRQRHNPISF